MVQHCRALCPSKLLPHASTREEKMSKPLSELTLATYKNCLEILKRKGFPDAETLEKNPKKVWETVEQLDCSASRKKQYISAIFWALKQDNRSTEIPLYKEKLKEQFSICIEQEESQKLSPDREKQLLPWQDILGLKDKVKEQYGDYSQEMIIYLLYTLQAPVRVDYADMVICRTLEDAYRDPRSNFCVHIPEKTLFVFQSYKTQKTYNTVIIEACPELHDILKKWLVNRKTLLNIKTPTSLGRKIIDIFEAVSGKKLGVSLLRHCYITWFLSTPRSIKEKRELAKKMLHSKELQERYALVDSGSESQ